MWCRIDSPSLGAGNATNTASNSTGIQDGSASLGIGNDAVPTASRYVDGDIGPVMIWNGTSLTTAQRAQPYAGGQAFSCGSIPANYAAPTVCCDLDETTGSRTCDTGSITLTEHNTVGSDEGIADIPGGVTLRAADFNSAANEHLSVADPWASGDIDFSVGAVVKPASLSANNVIASKYTSGAGNGEWVLYSAVGALTFRTYQAAGTINCTVASAVTPAVDGWYSILAYHDATANECGISVNGETYVTGATAAAGVDSTTDFMVGNAGGGLVDWDGKISPVAVWLDDALTAQADADNWFNSGDALACTDVAGVVGTAPDHCWELSEASGAQAAAIGGGRSATLSTAASIQPCA